MNDPARPEPKDQRPDSATYGRPEPADWRKYARITLWVVVAVIAAAFLIGNSQSVQVSFVFTSAEVPMFVALLIALVLGAMIGAGGLWLLGRRRAKAADRAKGKTKK